jgi:transcriptional regulator with XRE-family HTH domain
VNRRLCVVLPTFFQRVESLCLEQGISVNALAVKLKLSESTVTGWRAGAVPRIGTLKKIADYFGVSVEYFKCETDDPETKKAPTSEDAGARAEAIAGNIREACRDGDVPVVKMLKDLELGRDFLFKIEAQGHVPSENEICKISEYLDCPIDILLFGNNGPVDSEEPAGEKSRAEIVQQFLFDMGYIERNGELYERELGSIVDALDAFIPGAIYRVKSE